VYTCFVCVCVYTSGCIVCVCVYTCVCITYTCAHTRTRYTHKCTHTHTHTHTHECQRRLPLASLASMAARSPPVYHCEGHLSVGLQTWFGVRVRMCTHVRQQCIA